MPFKPNVISALARRCVGATIVLVASVAPTSSAFAQLPYLDHDDLTEELRSLADRSDDVRLSSLATTLEGREVWILEIANRRGAPLGERPALLVVANLEGDHLVGSHHAVATVRYILDNPDDEAVRALLDEQVLYVVPRLNPDGAEGMFTDLTWDRAVNARPVDDDNDGRIDEDGPDDLNGDGVITTMRVARAGGAYRLDDGDSRLLVKADPAKGEVGAYDVYFEGVDNDGDGFINEDGPGGVDLNRNFQHAYPYYGYGAGPHMVSELETRGLMDFVVAHRNIGAIFTFGHSDNVVTAPDQQGRFAGAELLDLMGAADASNADIFDVGVYPVQQGGFGFGFGFGGGPRFRGAQPGNDNDPSSGRRPAMTVNGEDREYFVAVSEAYKEMTGIEKTVLNRPAEGAFFQFGYFQFGVPSFSTQGWALPELPEEAELPDYAGEGVDAEVLGTLEAADVPVWVDWEPVSHPTLGDVEVGGFMPYTTTNPLTPALDDLGEKHGAFLVRLAGMLPRVTIADTEVTAHGGGVFTVEVEILNSGFFPTSLQHGVVSRSVQPTTVQIDVDPSDVVTGDPKSATTRRLEGSHNRERFSWVIRGRAGDSVEIRVRSQKGGSDTTTVTLR